MHSASNGTLTLVRGNKYFVFPLLSSPLQKLSKAIPHSMYKYVVLGCTQKINTATLEGFNSLSVLKTALLSESFICIYLNCKTLCAFKKFSFVVIYI